ncbi:MAG: PD-(D/E)XK nuclease family protein [Candidatus Aramenus sulfurataquae]|uniref:PD-(D/E)XK nuclease family protein n=2 Tax=Candidatus Aramenus sulfurataquae TaxID=1326980 RepID=A0AAE3FLU1_9CREN|nr:PD-(D/E)XK nuclease family protein [Candidatus Aramenus sulfurataquae]
MASAEEIKKILMENPSIIADVLIARPEIIYQALAKLTPWQNLATKSDVEALRKDVESVKANVETLRKEVEEIKDKMATKEDLAKLEKRLMTIITGIGARWGIMSEDAYRQGVAELLKDAGFEVRRELLYDKEGYVFGEPSEVEIDMVVKDGKVIMVEIMTAYRRADTNVIVRKREFYEKVKNVKVDSVIAVAAYVEDKNPERILARAQSLGIKVVLPTELNQP